MDGSRPSSTTDIYVRLPMEAVNVTKDLFECRTNEELEARLRSYLKRPHIKQALRHANPELMNNIKADEKLSERTTSTILRYLIRLSYRPTPFGMLSGIAQASISDHTKLAKQRFIKRSVFLTQKRNSYPTLKSELPNFSKRHFLTNPSLRLIGTEAWIWKEGLQEKLAISKNIRDLLVFCKNKKSFKEIVQYLAINDSDEKLFKHELYHLIQAGLLQIDLIQSSIGNNQATSRELSESSDYNFIDSQTNIDLKLELSSNEISRKVLSQIQHALEGLENISPYWKGDDFLWYQQLKEDFRNNYRGRGIPLLDFLHFHGKMIDHLQVAKSPLPQKVLDYIQDLIISAISENKDIILTDDDINQISKLLEREPHSHVQLRSFSAIVSLADPEKSKLLGKLIIAPAGHCGFRLQSRFSHLFQASSPVTDSPNQKTIIADIEYDSGDFVYDISRRPPLTKYYIRLSNTMMASSSTIPINPDDLDLYLIENKFRLFSRSLKKEIVPALLTPYQIHYHPHLLYRFLAFISMDGQKTNLQPPLMGVTLSYRPAFIYKNLVLSPKRWRMSRKKLLAIINKPGAREKAGLPRWVSIRHSDQTLPLDLENHMLATLILSKFQTKKLFNLEEEWHLNSGLLIEHEGKQFTQEIMFSLNLPSGTRQNHFIQTEKWNDPAQDPEAISIVLPSNLMDLFLKSALLPYMDRLVKKNILSGFYFLRFHWPFSEIRLRVFNFNGKQELWTELAKYLQKYRADFLITDIRKTPFESEAEAYGGKWGENIYHQISQVLSERYLRYQLAKETFLLSLNGMEKIPYDVCYLLLLERNLYDFFGIKKKVTSPPSEVEIRIFVSRFWKQYRGIFQKDHPIMLKNNLVVAEQIARLTLHLNELKKAIRSKKIKIKEDYFISRIIHLEFSRLLGGHYSLLEKSLPYLKNKIFYEDEI